MKRGRRWCRLVAAMVRVYGERRRRCDDGGTYSDARGIALIAC